MNKYFAQEIKYHTHGIKYLAQQIKYLAQELKISGTRDNCHFTALMSCSPGTSALWPPWVSSRF